MVWITSVSQAATVTLLSHNPSVHPQVIPTHNMSQVWLNVKSLSEIQTIDSNEDCIGAEAYNPEASNFPLCVKNQARVF